MTNNIPEGWKRRYAKAGGPKQYRYLLGNGRMLVVLQFSPRKWYYGDAPLGRNKGWTSHGKATNRDKAMALAHAYQQNHLEQQG